MQNSVSIGRAIDYTPASDVTGGQLIVLPGMVVVAATDIAAGETGACEAVGVFELAKASGAISQGAPVYVDSQGKITATASTTFAGVAWRAAAAGDATVDVSINFGSAPQAAAAGEQTAGQQTAGQQA